MPVERIRPLLGTLVLIRVDEGGGGGDVAAAIARGFAAIAHVHRVMSAQAADSDLAAIARAGGGAAVTVDRATAACLRAALRLAAASDGLFDPVLPGDGASWRDLALAGRRVRVARRLRLDLSGIAKGYAVDRACAALRAAGVRRAIVNAGGDLAVLGGGYRIRLAPGHAAPAAVVALDRGALASSDVATAWADRGAAQHRDGRSGAAAPAGFVSVVAPRCRDADALTKIVLVAGAAALPLLARHRAVAYCSRAGGDWQTLAPDAGSWGAAR